MNITSQNIGPTDLRDGDIVTLAGRRETVTSVKPGGDWILVHVIGDDGDPYTVRPHDLVPVHSRQA